MRKDIAAALDSNDYALAVYRMLGLYLPAKK